MPAVGVQDLQEAVRGRRRQTKGKAIALANKCSLHYAKFGLYRAANAIFGIVGRVAFEEIILQLITRKCLPILLYCLEVSPLTRNDQNSVDFVTVSSIFNVYVTLSFRCG